MTYQQMIKYLALLERAVDSMNANEPQGSRFLNFKAELTAKDGSKIIIDHAGGLHPRTQK